MDDRVTKPEHRRFPTWLTPLFGGLAGLSLATYMNLLGGQVAMFVVTGIAAAKALSFMDSVDHSELRGITPKATVTIVLLIASVFLFWIPVGGLVLISYAIHRSRWLDLSKWVRFPIACLFILSVTTTLICGIIFSM